MKLKELHESAGKSVADLKIKYTSGDFRCGHKELTSLIGAPKEVLGDFKCDNNQLTSLIGAPKEVLGDFNCDNNQLTSLEGAPKKVNGYFACDYNELTSLEGSPSKVSRSFYCSKNKLTSLEGAPKEVHGNFFCEYNELTSLEGIHLQIKHIGHSAYFESNPIVSHVLGLLLIDGLTHVRIDNKEVHKIINKYLEGSKDVIDCQNELMDAGLDEYAQL